MQRHCQGASYLYLLDDYSHTLAALLIYALLIGLILSLIRWKFYASILCAGIGYGAHLFADALVYLNGYAYFWPFSSTMSSIALWRKCYQPKKVVEPLSPDDLIS